MIHPAQSPPTPVERLLSPFARFARLESAGGIVLIACTLIALIAANSSWAEAYHHFWETEIALSAGGLAGAMTLHHLINDGLMAVFFFLVGLEIKRELIAGELASRRRAMLPVAAALGGMLVPAALYLTLNAGSATARGWGVPMATDIAFALGILALLGPRVPTVLKIFLTALAIVDDIGAVLVIALFYTTQLDWSALLAGFFVLGLCMAANRLRVRAPWVYVALGILLWMFFLASGIHATVAGVLLAMTIPASTRIDSHEFLVRSQKALDRFGASFRGDASVLTNPEQQEALHTIEQTAEEARAPLQRIEHGLHGIVAFGIVPLFALANAGVSLSGDIGAAFRDPITLGIVLGLVLGKPIGITLFSWLAVRLRLADLPAGTTWSGLHAVSWLGGIGFTMSLFVAGLAFTSPQMVDQAKLGIFTASLIAAISGAVLLRRQFRQRAGAHAERIHSEPESEHGNSGVTV